MNGNLNATEESQKKFFDKYALSGQWKDHELNDGIFNILGAEELEKGFKWLGDCTKVLDYGCGVGSLVNHFNLIAPSESRIFYGVDISNASIEVCKSSFEGSFACISNNKMPHILDSSIDGAYVVMILHHSENRIDIFKEVYRVLKPGGKIFIADLTSTNPIINLGRVSFPLLPRNSKKQFSTDLVIDGEIPEKLRVSLREVLEELKIAGFQVVNIERSQLFYFIFDWSDKVFGTKFGSRFHSFIRAIFQFEKFLLKFPLLAYFSHVFNVYAVALKNEP